ncbi:DoxX family protein [Alienimonas californiensis]|uniref:DoxX n=1 Tax=Alienimonas californiensis TaxID=2527989 RepID=A0A517P6Z3_9PLAN|nr:DoxX family membrane protein [Alienimonas californiensis]QDT15157.1 hypothetical protein CA12_12380 [Alienimonas californiensis]
MAAPLPRLRLRTAARWSLAAALVGAGLNHFFQPYYYLPLVPPALSGPGVWNAVAGAAEILGGVGLLVPRLRTAAMWGLIAMLVAFLWVHVEMIAYPDRTELGRDAPTWLLWARLPLQGVLIAWVWWVGQSEGTGAGGRAA